MSKQINIYICALLCLCTTFSSFQIFEVMAQLVLKELSHRGLCETCDYQSVMFVVVPLHVTFVPHGVNCKDYSENQVDMIQMCEELSPSDSKHRSAPSALSAKLCHSLSTYEAVQAFLWTCEPTTWHVRQV